MEEPSVLDYVLDKLTFWKKSTLKLPSGDGVDPSGVENGAANELEISQLRKRILVILTPLIAFIGQIFLEPPNRSVVMGVISYLVAGTLLVFQLLRGSWEMDPIREDNSEEFAYQVSWIWLAAGVLLSLTAFFMFAGNRFTLINIFPWLTGLGLVWKALWVREGWIVRVKERWNRFREQGLIISPWTIVTLLVFAVAAFFRFTQLEAVPPEMFSDHAEKLIDVSDVLRGQTLIFFPRNTGREAFQMYLTAAVSKIFGTGISFLSLKIGTSLAGLFTLPFIYYFGKEIAGRWAGLFGMFFAGVAYWPNVISRVALRFSLYPFFAAPVLYFLVRGLRKKRRNDFLFAGAALGLGLHGYSTFRIVPLVVAAVILIYMLHAPTKKDRRMAFLGLLIIALVSLIIFLPLLRYGLTNFEMFSYRMKTRLTGVEIPLTEPPLQIFLNNFLKTLVMFQWKNGNIWVHSVVNRPALGWVAAGLFSLGAILVLVRYLKKRNWVDLTLLVLIPLLTLPSTLSIAFPDENPSLNRTGGAIIPVFLIIGIMLKSLYRNLKWDSRRDWGKVIPASFIIILLLLSSSVNYQLVFEEYYHQFKQSAWNTSEIGGVLRQFSETVGNEDQAWVVPYPHWVDTRLVGIHAVDQVIDFALWQDDIPLTEDKPAPKLYIYKPEDLQTEEILRSLYPDGIRRLVASQVENRDFVLFYALK